MTTATARRRVPTPAERVRPPWLDRPLTSYYLVLVCTGLLLAIGLVMVFSASSVRSYATYGTSLHFAVSQGVYVAIGLPLMWAASRVPVAVWRKLALPMLLVSVGLLVLVLVPGIGRSVDGARRWIPMPGGINVQPSEIAKLAGILWGADVLVRKRRLLGEWKHLLVPLVPGFGFLALLVMLEPDMGTTIVLMSILMSLLWVVGAPIRIFSLIAGVALFLGAILAVTEPYRMARITGYLDPCSGDARLDSGFQACQGLQALTSGGLFGLGLGASSEKWAGGLPNPYTDFVYAIVGEELGLAGSLTVLLLFATLSYAGLRVARRTADPFARLVAAGITVWIAVQALVNIGTVVGVVPITGIPLPLLSYGGSALLGTMVALGILLAIARAEPGAARALTLRRRRRRPLPGR